jgi:acyl carrier protein
MQALAYLISENPVQLGYFNIDWKTWIGANQHAMRSSLFGHYYQLADTRTRTMGKWDELVGLLTPMSSEDRYLHVRQLLLEGLSGILKMPMTGIDPDKGINLLGIDSVMVVELISMIRNNVGINMLPMEFLTGPSVNHLAEVIIDKLPASKTEAVVA